LWGTQHDLQIIQTVIYLSEAVPSTPPPVLRLEVVLDAGAFCHQQLYLLQLAGAAEVFVPVGGPPGKTGAPGGTVAKGCLPVAPGAT